MNSSRQPRSDKSLQELLDQELQAEAELHQMDGNIQALEDKVIAKDWWDGNFIIRWSRQINEQRDHQLELRPKDRWFSISSVTSRPSAELLRIEDELLNNNETHPKTDARKKFIMKPKKCRLKDEKKTQMYEGQRTRKRVRRIRRPTKNRKTGNRKDQKKGK